MGAIWASDVASSQVRFEKLLERKGAVLTGTVDDSGPLQDAIDEVAYDVTNSERTGWARLPAETEAVRIDSTIELRAGLVCFDGQGARIDARNISSGYAVVPATRTTVPYNRQANAVPVMRQVKLIGPSADATTVDCIGMGSEIDGNARGCARVLFDNVSIEGFRDAIYIGSDSYLLEFHNLHVIAYKRYGIHAVCGTNAGERISFFGGGIFDGTNTGDSAVAVYMPTTGGGDLNFNGTSFSYNDKVFDVRSGTLTLNGCHQETNKTAHPFGSVENAGGLTPSCVFILGGTVGPTEAAANSRESIYELSGYKTSLRASCYFGLYNKSTQIIKVTSNAPQVDLSGSYLDLDGTTHFATVGTYLNRVFNGSFDNGALTGWATGGTGYTYTADAAVKNSGTHSLKMVSASGANGNAGFTFGVSPGKRLFVKGFVNVEARSAGSAFFRVRYFNQAANVVLSATDVGAWSTVTSGFELRRYAVTVPTGAVWAQVDIAGVGFTGTAYLDDVEAYEL